jgi:Protein of unknown function (DUF982)
MPRNRFAPICIMLRVGKMRNVTSVIEAGEALLDERWPDKRSKQYFDAVRACVAWGEGRAPIDDVREAFRAAAATAKVLIEL